MTCLECGTAELVLKYAEATEPHGERHWEEYWACPMCGEKFSEEDLKREFNNPSH
jgi:hypothetical protein